MAAVQDPIIPHQPPVNWLIGGAGTFSLKEVYCSIHSLAQEQSSGLVSTRALPGSLELKRNSSIARGWKDIWVTGNVPWI